MTIVRCSLALALALFLIFFGAMKFGGAHIFQLIEAKAAAGDLPGQGLFHPGLNTVTGLAEILAGLLIVLPTTRVPGLLLATGILGGALVFHLSPYLGVMTPSGFATENDGAPWTLADFPPAAEHTPVLFAIACGALVVAVLNLILTINAQDAAAAH